MKIENKISWGSIITIVAVLGGIILTAGGTSEKMINVQKTADTALERAFDNENRIYVIETKIEEGFKRIEEKIDLITNGQ